MLPMHILNNNPESFSPTSETPFQPLKPKLSLLSVSQAGPATLVPVAMPAPETLRTSKTTSRAKQYFLDAIWAAELWSSFMR